LQESATRSLDGGYGPVRKNVDMGSSDDVLGAFTAVLLQWLMAVLAVVSLAALASGQSPTTTPVLDEGVEVLHFERMSYPLYAKVRSIGGVVVLRAALDADGVVMDVTPLSGPRALLDAPVENLKKWRFGKAKQRTILVVYWFRFRGLCESPCPSAFEFYPPNLAVITSGHEVAMP